MGTGDAVVAEGTDDARARGRPAPGSNSDPGAAGRDASAGAMLAGATRAGAIGAIAVGVALLFLGYLRVSWTVAATADGAAQALQARDMLAGNWLLHGWTLSDVSFYTTELPEYVVVEAIRPFGLGVIHVAAALTYTLLVLAVFALARGRAGGREGVLRGLLAAVIMLAPQLGYGALVLLLSPDHVGTQVPLLAGWLLLDLAPRRWWVPAILCLLLAAAQFADRVTVLTAVLPLIVVAAWPRRVGALERPRRERGSAGRAGRGVGVGLLVRAGADRGRGALGRGRLGGGAAAGGGGRVRGASVPADAGAAVPAVDAHLADRVGILELYGGNFIGVTGWVGGRVRGAAPDRADAGDRRRRGRSRALYPAETPGGDRGSTARLGAGGCGRGELGQLPGVDRAGDHSSARGMTRGRSRPLLAGACGAALAGRVFGAAPWRPGGYSGAVPGRPGGPGLS